MFQASPWLIRPSNHISALQARPTTLNAHRTLSETLLVVADVRLVLAPPQYGSGGVLRTRRPLGPGYGAFLGGGERRGGARAAAPRAHCAVGRGRGPGVGLRAGAGPRAAPSRTPGSGFSAGAGRLSTTQPAGQRGALPALGSQHPGRDAGRSRAGPGLGVSGARDLEGEEAGALDRGRGRRTGTRLP